MKYTNYKKPDYFIDYTYVSLITSRLCTSFIKDGKEYRRADGGKFLHTFYLTCWIDPRGHFTQLRCCGIIVMDKIMKWFAKDKGKCDQQTFDDFGLDQHCFCAD